MILNRHLTDLVAIIRATRPPPNKSSQQSRAAQPPTPAPLDRPDDFVATAVSACVRAVSAAVADAPTRSRQQAGACHRRHKERSDSPIARIRAASRLGVSFA